VREGRLTAEQDKLLWEKQRAAIDKEDQKIVARYLGDDYEGIGRPLIPGSKLDPADYKISRLFRGKETRALVDKAELEAVRREQEESSATMVLDDPLAAPGPAPAAPSPPATVVEDQLARSFDDAEPDEEDEEGLKPAFKSAPGARGMDRVKEMTRIADYAVVQVLGAGGMGAVFLGQRDGAGELCAIKVMLNSAAGEKERGRFQREIDLGKKVRHKNIVGVIESGKTDDGLTYLVVPAIVGGELRSLLKKAAGKGLSAHEACDFFEQMLEGMQAVHDLRIVHRDLKPENVMIAGKERTVKIMDFGLAKLDHEAEKESDAAFRTLNGEVVGTPAYIAPESITGDPIDARTDIYSLGIIFFEMLTGKLPIEAATPEEYVQQHLICPPLSLHEARGGRVEWPSEADALFSRMLAKVKDERPASCKAILAELRKTIRPKLEAMEKGPPPPAEEPKRYTSLLGRLLGKGR
jgi:serine/threonine protein kinase